MTAGSGYKDIPQDENVDVLDKYATRNYVYDHLPNLHPMLRPAGLWLWGYGIYGNIGNDLGDNVSSPVQTICTGTNWVQSSGASNHAGGVKTDGSLWMWGNNGSGQLGDNTVTRRSSPVQTVFGGNDWKQVAAVGSSAGSSSLAIKTDGTMWGWGDGAYGKTALGTTGDKRSPVQEALGGTDWKYVTGGEHFGIALKVDGTIWGFGRNNKGQLGINSVTSQSIATQEATYSISWKHVACGTDFVHAIKNDGTLWGWGTDNYDCLAQQGSSADVHVPTNFVTGTWKHVSCGDNFTAAIKTDGSLWMWGRNAFGQLGTVDTETKSTPVQTVAAGRAWRKVECMINATAAIKADGSLWTWGNNQYGQLGTGDVINQSSPVQTIAKGFNWSHVETGLHFVQAISEHSLE